MRRLGRLEAVYAFVGLTLAAAFIAACDSGQVLPAQPEIEVESTAPPVDSTAPPPVPPPPDTSAAPNEIVVFMQDNVFSSSDVTVAPGTTILWQNAGQAPHTSTSDDGIWDSGTLNSGESWSWTVPASTTSGTVYQYFCVFHGAAGGIGMSGIIRVDSAAAPPPPAPPTPPPPPPPPAPPPPPTDTSTVADSIMVSMLDDFFQSRDITVAPGTKIIWRNDGGRGHTSTSDDAIWDSGTVNPGESWSWVVPANTASGTVLPYFCVFHGDRGGVGMSGVIRVDAAAPPPPPPPPPGTITVTTPGNTFSPERAEIPIGGTVIWEFSGATHNVTFKDASPPGGNIPDSTAGTSASRTFPVEDDYDYECTLHQDQKGRVRVR